MSSYHLTSLGSLGRRKALNSEERTMILMMARFISKMTCQHLLRQPQMCRLAFVHNLQMSLNHHPVRCFCDKQRNSESPEGSNPVKHLEGHRKAFFGARRRLSPLDRVTELIEESANQTDINIGQSSDVSDSENYESKNMQTKTENARNSHHQEISFSQQKSKAKHGKNSILVDGEFVYVVMENVKTKVNLREMFLLEAGKLFQCRYGRLEHTAVVGHLAGKVLLTDEDVPVLVRRPTLEEYVLHMKRAATISYPKDINAMLMMVDVSPGDVILEAGTGSGATSLHLSRAVWSGGTVHTYESNINHQKMARRNIEAWRRSYNLSHGADSWPENICFHSGPLQDAVIASDFVDGAILDLEEPHLMLSVIADKLKRGRAAAIYVSNLTQVIEIAEVIRVQQLPLSIEDIIDVTHKHWLVHPARRRQEVSPLNRLKVVRGLDVSVQESDMNSMPGDAEAYIIDHLPKYITRPKHKQPSFSAFLVKVRKILSSELQHKK